MSHSHIRIAGDMHIELWPNASRPHLTIVNAMDRRESKQQRVIVFLDEIETFRKAFDRAVELLDEATADA